MSSRTRVLLLLFTLLGLGAASMSAYVHYRLLHETRYLSFCDINDTFSCTQAYLSPYGALFGVPVAVLGVIWFVGALGIQLAGRVSKSTSENVPGYLFALSTAGLAMVLYLGYGAFFVLKTICLLCVTTYVAVIAIFLLSGSATPYPMTTLPGRVLRDLRVAAANPLALVTLLLFLGGAASGIAFFPREAAPAAAPAASSAPASDSTPTPSTASATPGDQQSEVERWFDSQPRAIVPVDPAGAAVLIVKFNDYQCPPCRQTYEQYKPIIQRLQAQNPGKIKYVTRDFPIDPECNPSTPNGMHQVACEAAVAVRLARQKGGDDLASKLEDWIFANQPALTQMGIKNAARDVAGVTDYDARYAGVLEQVKSDTALGALLGVRATPTFFINGVKIDGGLQPPFFETIITAELKKNVK